MELSNPHIIRQSSRSKEGIYEASKIGKDLNLLGFSILRLSVAQSSQLNTSAQEELVCVLLSGTVEMCSLNQCRSFTRRGPFLDLPSGAFIHPSSNLLIENKGDAQATLAVARGKVKRDNLHVSSVQSEACWIKPEQIEVFERGTGLYRRTIRTIIGEQFPADTLLCGETLNPPGHWSSFPPHKHDTPGIEGESVHEEIYFHSFDKPNGWGYQEVYSPERSESVPVRIGNGDVVLIPYGYHPVTAAPGYSLCYLWVLAGEKRKLEMKDDPTHAWINCTSSDAKPTTKPYRRIISEIPHPQSIALLETLYKTEAQSMHGQPPVVWDKASGYQVFDPYGNVFIDFSSGVLISNSGHNHPRVQQAILDEVQRGLLTSYLFPNAARARLVDGLKRHMPPGLEKVALFSTGSEAVEVTIKLARTFGMLRKGPRKRVVVSFIRSFHGRTMGAQLAGGTPEMKSWLEGLYPTKEFVQIPFPDGIYNRDLSFSCFEQSLRENGTNPLDVCAILVETYQGGIVSFAPVEYMRALRRWCDKNEALLICDEVQAGFGRTGRWWAFEHYQIIPDLVACGKGISSSLPISAVLGRKDLMDLYPPELITSTHSGNPVCCAAAAANIEIIEEEKLCDNAIKMGRIIAQELDGLKERYASRIRAISGRGLVYGVHLMKPVTKEPDAGLAKRVVWKTVSNGVLLFAPVGPGAATIKINPPLCITEEPLREGLSVLRQELIRELKQTN